MLQKTRFTCTLVLGAALLSASARAGDLTAGLKKGTPDLKSATALAFGPDGVLFVGDTQGAAVFAIATGDQKTSAAAGPLKVDGIDVILLDNMEQVAEAGPRLAELLAVATRVTLVVTSREPIRIRGECEYAVPPLADDEAIQLGEGRRPAGPGRPDSGPEAFVRATDHLGALRLSPAAGREPYRPR